MSRFLGDPPPATTYREYLSLRLRELALAKFDKSAAKFAEALQSAGLKLDKSNVYHWLSGQRYPDIEHLRKIADVLDVSLDELVTTCPKHLEATVGLTRARTGKIHKPSKRKRPRPRSR